MFYLQKVSNHGTSTPAVARTILQEVEIISFFECSDEKKETCKGILISLCQALLRCVEISDRVLLQIAEGKSSISLPKEDGQPNAKSNQAILPGVTDLQGNAESFLQSAKLAIRHTAELVGPFYGTTQDHRFHKFAAWADKNFGSNDTFAQSMRDWEPWVARIVAMRNAVEHPKKGPKGRLVVANFRFNTQPDAALIEPSWGLSGEAESLLAEDMSAIIEGCLQLGEEIIAQLFYKQKLGFPLAISVIPEEERDPRCPKRHRVAIENNSPA
jgi:hypothetical protein